MPITTRPFAMTVALAILCHGLSKPALSSGAGSVQVRSMQDPDVRALLSELGKRYGSLTAYGDRGEATLDDSAAPARNHTQRFTTQFERAGRFSWVSDLGRGSDYRIVADGGSVRVRAQGRDTTNADLGTAIARATGISNSAAFWIPSLLMPEVFPGDNLVASFERASRVTKLRDEALRGHQCIVLESMNDGVAIRVWIDQRDFLIRRIEERTPLRIVVTTDFYPRLDIALP